MNGPIFGPHECCGATSADPDDHYAWCGNSPEKRAAASADWRTHNEQVFSELRARFEVGAREYGDRSWSADPATLKREIEAELLDVMNWASIALYRLRNTPAQPVDEQAAETVERLRVDVRRLEKSLAQEKTDHERTRRAAEGRLP